MRINWLIFRQTLVFIFIFILAVCIQSESLWLIIVVYLLFKSKLIDKNDLCFLNDIRQAWNGQYKTENVSNQEQREIYENITIENDVQISDKQEFLEGYKDYFSKIIKWFKYDRNIQFEVGKKLKFSNGKIIYPDGIIENRNNDTILEFKMCSTNLDVIKSQILEINRYQEYYNSINKNVDFYFTMLVKGRDEIPNITKIIEENKMLNLNLTILFFQEQNNNLAIIKESKYGI